MFELLISLLLSHIFYKKHFFFVHTYVVLTKQNKTKKNESLNSFVSFFFFFLSLHDKPWITIEMCGTSNLSAVWKAQNCSVKSQKVDAKKKEGRKGYSVRSYRRCCYGSWALNVDTDSFLQDVAIVLVAQSFSASWLLKHHIICIFSITWCSLTFHITFHSSGKCSEWKCASLLTLCFTFIWCSFLTSAAWIWHVFCRKLFIHV